MEFILAPFFNALGDRLRGGLIPREKRIISAQIYGLIIFVGLMWYLADLSWVITIGLAIAYYAGESFGWGGPLGDYLRNDGKQIGKVHKWQVGFLKDFPEWALLARGAMWGLPIGIVLGFVDPSLGLITVCAYTVSMLAAPAIAIALWPSQDAWTLWQRQEYIRGFYVMCIISTYLYLTQW